MTQSMSFHLDRGKKTQTRVLMPQSNDGDTTSLCPSLSVSLPHNKHSKHTLHTFSLLCPFVEANSTHYTKKTRSGLEFEGEYPQVTGHFLNSLEVSRRFSYLSLSRIVRHPEIPAARTESEGGGLLASIEYLQKWPRPLK